MLVNMKPSKLNVILLIIVVLIGFLFFEYARRTKDEEAQLRFSIQALSGFHVNYLKKQGISEQQYLKDIKSDLTRLSGTVLIDDYIRHVEQLAGQTEWHERGMKGMEAKKEGEKKLRTERTER